LNHQLDSKSEGDAMLGVASRWSGRPSLTLRGQLTRQALMAVLRRPLPVRFEERVVADREANPAAAAAMDCPQYPWGPKCPRHPVSLDGIGPASDRRATDAKAALKVEDVSGRCLEVKEPYFVVSLSLALVPSGW
jgi:hypothetical protein